MELFPDSVGKNGWHQSPSSRKVMTDTAMWFNNIYACEAWTILYTSTKVTRKSSLRECNKIGCLSQKL